MRWNSLSTDRGGYQVRLLPGSATFEKPTLALFHHNPAAVIGNTENGTLRIMPDDVGVKVEIDLPKTSVADDVAELVDKGYIGGMSFAITGSPAFTMTNEGDRSIMNISQFTCDEVTVTAIPSFTDTSIAVDDPNYSAKNKNTSSMTGLSRDMWNLNKYKLALMGRDP